MKRVVYTVEDETTNETVAADTCLSELEDAGALIAEFSPDHRFIIEVHTLH